MSKVYKGQALLKAMHLAHHLKNLKPGAYTPEELLDPGALRKIDPSLPTSEVLREINLERLRKFIYHPAINVPIRKRKGNFIVK